MNMDTTNYWINAKCLLPILAGNEYTLVANTGYNKSILILDATSL